MNREDSQTAESRGGGGCCQAEGEGITKALGAESC